MESVRVLLVDDEAALLDLLKKYLERLGYEVDACAAPEDAVACFDADPKRYAVVLTDLTLPGMNGEQLLEHMMGRNPALRAIITSGYPYVPRSKNIVFLQKPFLPKMLAEAIGKVVKKPGG